jgi:hypothetical protein
MPVNDENGEQMFYLKWTRRELETLSMDALYTEVDADGWVQREVGLAPDGLVIHQLAVAGTQAGWFGLARLSAVMLNSNVSKDEFEALWDGASAPPC